MSKPTFQDFLSYFPELELPITVAEDYINTFSTQNKLFTTQIVEEFILRWQDQEPDEFTEFVPCFKIAGTQDFHAIVYWKGSLLRYDYILTTLDKNGNFIAAKIISSTLSDNQSIRKSVARIDEDLIIYIVAGENDVASQYKPEQSQNFSMEILPSGDIIFATNE